MRVFLSRVSFTLALTLATSPFLFADYTYQETTQLTGGSLLNMMKMVGHFSSQARKAGEPVVSTVRALRIKSAPRREQRAGQVLWLVAEVRDEVAHGDFSSIRIERLIATNGARLG